MHIRRGAKMRSVGGRGAGDDRDRYRPGLPPPRAGERIFLSLVLLVNLTMIGLGLYLHPERSGHSTHTQLGLPPCGTLLRTGRPCPLCGGTTAYTLAVRGRLLSAFWAHPSGLLLFLINLFLAWQSLAALVRNRSLLLRVALWPWGRLVVGLVAWFLASWWFKLITWE